MDEAEALRIARGNIENADTIREAREATRRAAQAAAFQPRVDAFIADQARRGYPDLTPTSFPNDPTNPESGRSERAGWLVWVDNRPGSDDYLYTDNSMWLFIDSTLGCFTSGAREFLCDLGNLPEWGFTLPCIDS